MDAWTLVKQSQKRPSRWQVFIDRWSDPGYREWVDYLASVIDDLASQTPPAVRDRMLAVFRTGLFYEIRFWDMALEGPVGYVGGPDPARGQLFPPEGRK
jgi:thiaminase